VPIASPAEKCVTEKMLSKQLNDIVGSLNPEEQMATLSTLKRIFDNIIQHPNDEKYRQIKLAGKTFSSKVWQYPAGEELMKMSGWVVEGDHVRLRDDSHVQIVSQLLKSLCEHQHTKHVPSSVTSIVPIPLHIFQALIQVLLNGHVFLVHLLLKNINISTSGRVYFESGSSANLLSIATIGQQIEIIKLLFNDYSVDPYAIEMDDKRPYIFTTFSIAPQSFIMNVLKCCGVKCDFKADGFTLLHIAVFANCFDIVQFLVEECNDMDVNVTDDDLQTPLHKAYLARHTQIAEYLIQHGADVYAIDGLGCTPYEYIDGQPKFISHSEHIQNKRRIHHTPFSTEHYHFVKLINNGISETEAVSLTIEQFPSLKEDGPTQSHDIDHASALKEFTQYVTKGLTDDNPWRQPLSQEQRQHVLFST